MSDTEQAKGPEVAPSEPSTATEAASYNPYSTPPAALTQEIRVMRAWRVETIPATAGALADWCRRHPAPDIKPEGSQNAANLGFLITPAEGCSGVGHPKIRGRSDVAFTHGCQFDLDKAAGHDIEATLARVRDAGYAAVFWRSHSDSQTNPSGRLLVLLDPPCPASEHAEVCEGLRQALCPLAPKGQHNANRGWNTPRTGADVVEISGRPVDWRCAPRVKLGRASTAAPAVQSKTQLAGDDETAAQLIADVWADGAVGDRAFGGLGGWLAELGVSSERAEKMADRIATLTNSAHLDPLGRVAQAYGGECPLGFSALHDALSENGGKKLMAGPNNPDASVLESLNCPEVVVLCNLLAAQYLLAQSVDPAVELHEAEARKAAALASADDAALGVATRAEAEARAKVDAARAEVAAKVEAAREVSADVDAAAPGPFPIHVLPKTVQTWVRAVEEQHRVPTSFIGMAALGAMCSAVQGNAAAEVQDGYATPLGLYIVAAAPPGTAKSPVIKAAFGPLHAWEDRTAKDMAPQLASSRANRTALEQERRALRDQLGKSNRPLAKAEATGTSRREAILAPDEIERVKKRLTEIELQLDLLGIPAKEFRYLVEDATPQSLVPLFAAHGRLACVADEGAEVFDTAIGRQHARSGEGSCMHVLLKAYDGEGVAIDRKGSDGEGVRIKAGRAHLAICIATQPEVLFKIMADGESASRGLLDRFCVVLCEAGRGRASVEDLRTPMPAHVQADYARLIEDMARETGTKYATKGAFAVWNAYEFRATNGGRPKETRDVKHAWRAVRIAGILACANREMAITEDTMRAAIELSDWLDAQWKHASERRTDDDLIAKIVKFVAAQPKAQATGRDIQRKFKRQIPTATRMRELLADSVTFGALVMQEVKGKSPLVSLPN